MSADLEVMFLLDSGSAIFGYDTMHDYTGPGNQKEYVA
jgi:hypothetical protein